MSRFDASSTTPMFQDSVGTIKVTAAGQQVCRWADVNGGTAHAEQSTPARCPRYGTDATGGYLDFDANGFLTVAVAVSGMDGTTSAFTSSLSGRAAVVSIRLGADGAADRYGDGKYREVWLFNRALSAAELAQVAQYLIAKWKLT